MTQPGRKWLRALPGAIRGGWLALVLLLIPLACAAAEKAPGPSGDEIAQGARIYREGILPSGGHLRVAMKGGGAVPGLTFSCASCHLRGGFGAYEEGVLYPAINGDTLFAPLPRIYKGIVQEGLLRPAYTDQTLAEVLRTGRDPNGKLLSDAMPRYQFSDDELRVLIAYLKALSSGGSPGVTDTSIRFATVISEDVPQASRDAIFAVLDRYFTLKNNQIRSFENPRNAKSRLMSENMMLSRELTGRSLQLSRWVLKGPPETWRGQLEEYNRKDPVFALLGGIVGGAWEPVHRFCEENRIPCLFPNTELPVISNSDWYTLYQSKGFYQEGEGAARFLAELDESPKGPVLQLVRRSDQGKALAEGFRHTWNDLGQSVPVVTLDLPGGPADRKFLERIVAREKPAVLLLWDDASALPGVESLAGLNGRPELVILSSRYLGDAIWDLKEPIRGFTYLTYPFAFSVKLQLAGMQFQVREDRQPTLKRADLPVKGELQKLVTQTNALTQMLTGLLMDLKGRYYRDNLLDVTAMAAELAHPLYGRVTFATDRRYASQGCYVVQLSKGDNPELVKKSRWLAP